MVNSIKTELLKQKHSFNTKLIWLSPLVPIVIALVLMAGRYLVEVSYNWWYTLLLPGTLAIMVSFGVTAEKKHNRHGLFSVCVDKGRLWMSQVFVNTIYLFLTNLIFYVFVTASCLILGIPSSTFDNFLAVIVLFLTYMWQIPVFMWLSEKMGIFVSILVCLLCNIGLGIFFSPTKLWFVPFAIPARLMCAIIKVHPNGVPLEASNPLCDGFVVPVGIGITVGLYLVFLLLTTLWFRRQEVR